MTVKWGLLSTARVNKDILTAASRSVNAEVVAVASRRREQAVAYAQEHRIPRAFGSYQELLDDPDIEVVYISLPNSLHAEWSIRALQAGKHVLCEKPLTRRAHEVRAIFEAAHRSKRVCMEGLMYRHHPQTLRLTQLLAEGVIGRVQFIRASLSFELLVVSDIRLSPDLDGGAMMDLGCYCVSSLRLVAGEPLSVSGLQVTTDAGVDSRFFGTLVFSDEVVGQFDVAFTLPRRSRLEIIGTRGTIVISDPWMCENPGIEVTLNGKTETLMIEAVSHYDLEIANMSRAARGMESTLLGHVDALGQARTIEALYSSAAAGRTITLPELDQ
jgi:predicted dehydrogenase